VTPQQSFDRNADPDQASAAAAPAPAPTTQPPQPTPAPKPAEPVVEPAAWKIAGLVYYLRDTKPAAGVDIDFSPTEGGASRKSRTGKDGRYSVSLPILSSGAGYRVTLRKGGRELAYLEEAALPYRSRSKAQREDAIEEAKQAPVLHAPLTPEGFETSQDFALLP
jgi:hypothetical protein